MPPRHEAAAVRGFLFTVLCSQLKVRRFPTRGLGPLIAISPLNSQLSTAPTHGVRVGLVGLADENPPGFREKTISPNWDN